MDNIFQDTTRRSEQALPLRYKLENRYEIGQVLTETETAFIYHAQDTVQNKVVIVQELFPKQWVSRKLGDPIVRVRTTDGVFPLAEAIDKSMRDGQILLSVRNNSLASVTNVFKTNSTAYIVSEPFSGMMLSEWQQRQNGIVSEKMALQIALLILSGLKELHDHGIVHRNLNPQTIMVDQSGRVKIASLGMSSQMMSNLNLAKMTAFDAPELFYANMTQGTWTDLYSIGATLYQLLTNNLPTLASERVKQDVLIPAKQWNYSISDALNDALSKLLALDPVARFQSVGELAKILHPIYKTASSQVGSVVSVPPTASPSFMDSAAATTMMPSVMDSSAPNMNVIGSATRDLPVFPDNATSSERSLNMTTDVPPTAFAKAMTTSDWMNTSEASKGWEDKADSSNWDTAAASAGWDTKPPVSDWSAPKAEIPPTKPLGQALSNAVSTPVLPVERRIIEPTTAEVLASVSKEPSLMKGSGSLPPLNKPKKAASKFPVIPIFAGIAILLLAVGAWWFFLRPQPIPLKIAVNPPGSQIILKPLSFEGETLKAKSPVTVELKEGEYEITIQKDGYLPITQRYRVAPAQSGQIRELALTLEPDSPELQPYNIDSLPSGAAVVVDGAETGKTTPTILSLTPGYHTIQYRLNGYDLKEYALEVPALTGAPIVLQDTLVAVSGGAKPAPTNTAATTTGAVAAGAAAATAKPTVRQTPKPQPRATPAPAPRTSTTPRPTTTPQPTTAPSTPVQRPPSTQPRVTAPVTTPTPAPTPAPTTPQANPTAPKRNVINRLRDRIRGGNKESGGGSETPTTGGGNGGG